MSDEEAVNEILLAYKECRPPNLPGFDPKERNRVLNLAFDGVPDYQAYKQFKVWLLSGFKTRSLGEGVDPPRARK